MIYIAKDISKNALVHYGTKNMKWGVRRFQNEDGTLTEAGKKRYLHMGNNHKLGSAIQAQEEKNKHYDTDTRAFQMKYTQYFKDKGINESHKYSYNTMTSSNNDYAAWNKSKDNLLRAWTQSRINSYTKNKANDADRRMDAQIYNDYNKFNELDYAKVQGELDKERNENRKKYGANVAEHIYTIQNDYLRDYAYKHNINANNVAKNASSGMPTSAKADKQKAENSSKYKQSITKNASSGMPASAISAKAKAEGEAKMKKNIPASAWNQRASSATKR